MNPSDEKWIPREEAILTALCDTRAILSIFVFVVVGLLFFGFRSCSPQVRDGLVSAKDGDVEGYRSEWPPPPYYKVQERRVIESTTIALSPYIELLAISTCKCCCKTRQVLVQVRVQYVHTTQYSKYPNYINRLSLQAHNVSPVHSSTSTYKHLFLFYNNIIH